MPNHRCAHFAVEVEELAVAHTAVVLQVPVRRCGLSERMIAVISGSDDGREVARKLLIATSSYAPPTDTGAPGAPQTDTAAIRVAFGPDLEAIHPAECTVQRCQESCTPSYKMLVRHFGFEDAAERETEEGCLEAVGSEE